MQNCQAEGKSAPGTRIEGNFSVGALAVGLAAGKFAQKYLPECNRAGCSRAGDIRVALNWTQWEHCIEDLEIGVKLGKLRRRLLVQWIAWTFRQWCVLLAML